jgi:hypothetical protein
MILSKFSNTPQLAAGCAFARLTWKRNLRLEPLEIGILDNGRAGNNEAFYDAV